MSTQDTFIVSDFSIVTTGDGSPSLCSLSSPQQEIMHHSGGAFSETEYIYLQPLRWALGLGARNILSLGLGLGYHELGFFKYWQEQSPQERDNFSWLTFESSAFLRQNFLLQAQGHKSGSSLDSIFEQMLALYGLQSEAARADLKALIRHPHFELAAALSEPFPETARKYQVILYDAFSRKTSPELWEPEFLQKFLFHFCAPDCVWLTYACLSPLKRTLVENGFDLWVRPGFQGKRNATWAVRGQWVSEFKNQRQTFSHTP